MRTLNRNARPLYYANLVSTKPVRDSNGFLTGESTNTYTEPEMLMANVSASVGEAEVAVFGDVTQYSRVVCLAGACPFDEQSKILFDSKEYKVVKIADSINGTLVAIREVVQ